MNGAVVFLLASAAVGSSLAALPQGCTPLNDHPLALDDPGRIFGENSELQGIAAPVRVGNIRSRGAIPTHHFAINQMKTHMSAMRLLPYSAVMDTEGIAYDAYTMDRWNNPARTDTMLQQTPSKAGDPYDKVESVGTNMRQMVAGPDGNPLGEFTGHSGIKVGLAGSGEPEMTDFGDLYANFEFKDTQGGRMEASLVRGSPILTHIFTTANPVIKPYCLSSINGHDLTFDCPVEPQLKDGGSGGATATCSGSHLEIKLHNTKVVSDVHKIQWAAATSGQWGASHGMHNCDDSACHLSADGKIVTISTPITASGTMNYAINYIGSYILPHQQWDSKPYTVQCAKKREAEPPSPERRSASLSASCTSDRKLTITVHLGGRQISGVDKIQYAVESSSTWQHPPAMHTCTDGTCQLNGDTVTINVNPKTNDIKYAINIIGYTTLPEQNWIDSPYQMTCGKGQHVDTGHQTTSSPNHSGGHQTTSSSHHTGGHLLPLITPETKFFLELNEPGTALPGQTRKFVLYFTSQVVASSNGNEITFSPQSGGKYTGLVQVAYLGAGPRGDNSNENFLDAYKGVYPYKPEASFCGTGSRGYINFEWNKHDVHGPTLQGSILMIAMPHQEPLLQRNGPLIDTPYGFKGYVGSNWLMEETLPAAGLEPDMAAVAKTKAQATEHQQILKAIESDASGTTLHDTCTQSNSYGVGKEIAMATRLASISRAYGTNHYQSLDNSIKICLEKWLRIDDTLTGDNKFYYDMVYGGLLLRGKPDGVPLDPNSDFGFPLYNDHHFHLGYFLYAMAYYVKNYKTWGQSHKDRIYLLARDVGNPSTTDSFFPIARHKDIFMGMSWATGVVGGTRQEESSTEGINCYHGLAALGDAFGDDTMKYYGQIMLAMEIRSVREYYHVRAHNRQNFPPLIQKYGTIGQLAEGAFFVYTLDWACDPAEFPMRHACLVGIQVMPLTAISHLYVDREWAGSVREVCTWAVSPHLAPGANEVDQSILKPVTTGWAAFCHAVMSKYDDTHKTAAVNFIKDLTHNDLVGGTGAASTLLFIYGDT